MRDFGSTLIFEGSSEISTCSSRAKRWTASPVAGDWSCLGRLRGSAWPGLVVSAAFYGVVVPSRWLGWSLWPVCRVRAAGDTRRFVERRLRRLARSVSSMIRFGKRSFELTQSVLFRLVDVPASLFAMAATCPSPPGSYTKDRCGGRPGVKLADCVASRPTRIPRPQAPASQRDGYHHP